MALGNSLLGIPLLFWGFGCLAVAAVYYQIWPQPSPKRRVPRTRFGASMLRYGHALVWVLLAAGCFLAGAGLVAWGLALAIAAVPLYIAFLAMLIQDRGREQADLDAQRKAKQGA